MHVRRDVRCHNDKVHKLVKLEKISALDGARNTLAQTLSFSSFTLCPQRVLSLEKVLTG